MTYEATSQQCGDALMLITFRHPLALVLMGFHFQCKEQVKGLALDRLNGKSGGSKKSGSKKDKDSGASASIELTSSNFDKVVGQSDEPWLVEFFAPWYVFSPPHG